jgi:hypothetical protein
MASPCRGRCLLRRLCQVPSTQVPPVTSHPYFLLLPRRTRRCSLCRLRCVAPFAVAASSHMPLLRHAAQSCPRRLPFYLSLSLSHDQHRPDHLASLSDVKLKLRASITTHSDERHRGYPAAFLPSAPSWSDPLLLLLEQDSPEPSSPCR